MIVDARRPNLAVIRKLIVYGNLMATLLTKYADDLDEGTDGESMRIERALAQEWEKTLLEYRKGDVVIGGTAGCHSDMHS